MKSIQNEVIEEIVINKSTFINYLAPVHTVDEALEYLESLRQKYPDANHHCYAYVIGDNQDYQKFSDDGEPSKTAGLPMIEVLKKNDLTDVINVSIRYFGGIKLGAGGLVRAYTKGCAACVKKSEPSYKTSFSTLKVSVDFDYIGVCEKYLREETTLLNTVYDSKVNYTINIKTEYEDDVINSLTHKTKGSVITDVVERVKKYI